MSDEEAKPRGGAMVDRAFWIAAAVGFALFIAAFIAVFVSGIDASNRSAPGREASGERFDASDSVSLYVATDRETGVQYLLAVRGYGAGLAVVVGADGTPLLAEGYGGAE